MIETILAPAPFDPHDALRRFSHGDDAGACASFIGFCRGDGPHGPVEWLELEHYPGFTEQEIAAIAGALVTRHALIDLLAIHRVGQVLPGEPIVLAAARSRHRGAAFTAVEQMMDYLKTDAPFWKKEKRADGVHWIEPTAEDRRRRAAHQT
jgi:molybdopterin synthase catalytic subunit